MNRSFDTLVYDSDNVSETSESLKFNLTIGGRRSSRRRSSIILDQAIAMPVRRSRRLTIQQQSKEEPKDDFGDDKQTEVKKGKQKKGQKTKTENKKQSECKDDVTIKVMGATEINDQLKFVIKINGKNDPEIISNEEAKEKYPYAIMEFYESCMEWNSTDSDDSNYASDSN